MSPPAVAPEREPGRFVFAAMVSPYTLPILGGSLLAATALGIHLGESSVGLINPIYFQGPAVHPRDRGAAIDESRPAPRPSAYGALYGWEQGVAARAADCGDCEALRARAAYARDYSAEVPWFGGPAQPRADETSEAVVPVILAEEVAPGDAGPPKDAVLRYAHYPVDAGEMPEAAVVEEPADQAKVPPADDFYRE